MSGTEGEDFEALFGAGFASDEGLDKRIKKDRRSGKTSAQRALLGRTRTLTFNLRCSPAFKAAADALATARGISMADLLHDLVEKEVERSTRQK